MKAIHISIPESLYEAILRNPDGRNSQEILNKLREALIHKKVANCEDTNSDFSELQTNQFIVPKIPKAILFEDEHENGIIKKTFNDSMIPFPFFHHMGNLKKVKRTGWMLAGIESKHVESVAEHMYRMAMLALSIPRSTTSCDMDKCIKMCLVHDVAEAITGDIPPSAQVMKETKYKMEYDAIMQYKVTLSNDNELIQLWQEYEEQKTPEAILVKDLDRFEFLCQAYEYEIEFPQLNLDEFFHNTRHSIKTNIIKEWLFQLEKYRNAYRTVKTSN